MNSVVRADVVAKLRDMISDIAGLDPTELGDDDSLFSGGLIDSISLINIVTFVEGQLNFRVGAEELRLENWDSLRRIQTYLDRRAPS